MNLVSLLDEQAERNPDQLALADGKSRLTFGELLDASVSGAQVLKDVGLRKGDAVLFFHPVKVELYTSLLSVIRAGMIAVFVDPSAPPSFIEECCGLVRPKGFFGSAKAHLLRLKIPGMRGIPVRFHTGRIPVPGSKRWLPNKGTLGESLASIKGGETALITFTSGSTGKPKGVARSHEFLIAQHKALESSLNLKSGDIDLVTLPVFVLANLASGTSSIIADTNLARPGEIAQEAVAKQIVEEKISRIVASPAFFESLLGNGGCSFDGVESVYTGGAPVFPRLLSKMKKSFPNASVTAVYGSTEAEPIAEISFDQISSGDLDTMKNGGGLLAGVPVPEIELQILDGEILVTGDHVLKSYLNGKGDSETKVNIDGVIWHRTGDLGRVDESGRLWLLGRKSALIGDVKPFSVECAASFLSESGRTAVIEWQGEAVLVAATDAGGNADLESLAQSFGINRVLRIAKIPMDRRHNAKVDYPALLGEMERRFKRV